MIPTARVVVSLVLVIGVLSGCSTAPRSPEGKDRLVQRGATALKEWNTEVPGIDGFARGSYGYAVFPRIGKGGLGVGAAYGQGVVYAQGEHIGYADLSQASLGLQAGGQAYQVLLVFGDGAALERFKRNQLELSPNAFAVALTAGYVVDTQFIDGVTVVARPIGGLMGGVAIGGERFTFAPKGDQEPSTKAPPPAGTR